MTLSFNTDGNLHETVELSFQEFQQRFGTNASRKEKIRNAVKFFGIFRSCGCKAVYIAGSFVSKKENPEDIDLLFDIAEVDKEALDKAFPGFFDDNRHKIVGTIRRISKCHIFTFQKDDMRMLKLLQFDRRDCPKGFVKINFEKELNYD